jgi:hypothetical protein
VLIFDYLWFASSYGGTYFGRRARDRTAVAFRGSPKRSQCGSGLISERVNDWTLAYRPEGLLSLLEIQTILSQVE